MPRGFSGAQKVGKTNWQGFRQKPRGVVYFSLKDQQEAIVRFLTEHNEIDWLRQWKMAPNSAFPFGEKIPCVDQHEDGTPDPGYQAGLRSTFTGYAQLIWRNAPSYQKAPDGSLVRDANNAKILTGYADTVALWEHSYTVYEILGQIANDYRGLMSRDFKIRRTGSGAKDTKYFVVPATIDGGPEPMSPADMQLAAINRMNLADYLKVPTYDELHTYINGVPAPAAPTTGQQVGANDAAAAGAGVGEGPNPFLGS